MLRSVLQARSAATHTSGLLKLQGLSSNCCAVAHADGTQLVAGVGARVLVYDASDGELLHALKGHKVGRQQRLRCCFRTPAGWPCAGQRPSSLAVHAATTSVSALLHAGRHLCCGIRIKRQTLCVWRRRQDCDHLDQQGKPLQCNILAPLLAIAYQPQLSQPSLAEP